MFIIFLNTPNAYAILQNVVSFDCFLNFIQGQKVDCVSLGEYKVLHKIFLQDLTPSKQPKLIIVAGGPGTGKSTYRKKYLESLENFHIHDMDEILVRLKGYQNDLHHHGAETAFNNWWPKAQKIANQFANFAFSIHLNVIYDRTCGTENSLNDLKYAVKELGYHAVMYAFTIPAELATTRVRERFKTDGRIVTDTIVVEYAKRFSALFLEYNMFIDEIHLFSGSEEIYTKEDFQINVKNENLYAQFLNFGQEYR